LNSFALDWISNTFLNIFILTVNISFMLSVTRRDCSYYLSATCLFVVNYWVYFLLCFRLVSVILSFVSAT
jgi:hypothetical protein